MSSSLALCKKFATEVLTKQLRKRMIVQKALHYLEFFVQPTIPQISMFALLIHMTIGCCWHHEHASMAIGSELSGLKRQSCACSSHHQDSENYQKRHYQDGSRNQAPCNHQCQAHDCVFIRSGPSQQQLGLLLDELCPPVTTIYHQICHPMVMPPRLVTDMSLCSVGPPIRTNLLHQILLI